MIRVGVLGTSDIARRRMIPAILNNKSFKYQGVAIALKSEIGIDPENGYLTNLSDDEFAPAFALKKEKARQFAESFGGSCIEGYEEMLKGDSCDAVYIPLPPSLHFRWAMRALSYGKHVLMEKPFTSCERDTGILIKTAKEKKLAVIENYGFCYHRQMDLIRKKIKEGLIGDLRLVRAAFGFPRRNVDDFRYSRNLGGGALLDCGGYTIKLAQEFLHGPIEVMASAPVYIPDFEVDIGGSVMLKDKKGLSAQLSYGMDHAYKCELELWGTEGSIYAPRIFTAPNHFDAIVQTTIGNETVTETAEDDQFEKILNRFKKCIEDENVRQQTYHEILAQAELVEKCFG